MKIHDGDTLVVARRIITPQQRVVQVKYKYALVQVLLFIHVIISGGLQTQN